MARKKRKKTGRPEPPYVPPPKEPPRFVADPMCHNCGETISRDQDGTICVKCGHLIRFGK